MKRLTLDNLFRFVFIKIHFKFSSHRTLKFNFCYSHKNFFPRNFQIKMFLPIDSCSSAPRRVFNQIIFARRAIIGLINRKINRYNIERIFSIKKEFLTPDTWPKLPSTLSPPIHEYKKHEVIIHFDYRITSCFLGSHYAEETQTLFFLFYVTTFIFQQYKKNAIFGKKFQLPLSQISLQLQFSVAVVKTYQRWYFGLQCVYMPSLILSFFIIPIAI